MEASLNAGRILDANALGQPVEGLRSSGCVAHISSSLFHPSEFIKESIKKLKQCTPEECPEISDKIIEIVFNVS